MHLVLPGWLLTASYRAAATSFGGRCAAAALLRSYSAHDAHQRFCAGMAGADTLGMVCGADDWIPDESVERCAACREEFGIFRRRHHCRHCGYVFCADCSGQQYPLRQNGGQCYLRVCDRCFELLADAQRAQTEAAESARQRTRTALLAETDLAAACYQEAQEELGFLVERSELPQLGAPVPLAQIGTRGATEKSFHLCMSTRPRDDAEETDAQSDGTKAMVVLMRLPEESAICPESDSGLRHLRQFLLSLDHPFVHRTHDVAPALDDTALVLVRQYWPLGSLKDRLHRLANPLQPAVQKYGPDECGPAWPFTRVRLLGRQILEGLRYLCSVGLPCAAVHSGNILMRSDEWCVISEMEIDLAGLEPMGGITVQMERTGPNNEKVIVPAVGSAWVVGEKQPAVAAFGHILYEMVSGGRVLMANEMPITDTFPQGLIDCFELIFPPDGGAALGPGCRLTKLLELSMFADLSLHPRHTERLISTRQNSLELRRILRKGLVGLLPPSLRGKRRNKRESTRDPPASWEPAGREAKKVNKKRSHRNPRNEDDLTDGVMLLEDGRLDTSTVKVRYPSGYTAILAPKPQEDPKPVEEVQQKEPPPGSVKVWLQRIIGGYEVSGMSLQPNLNGRYYPVPQPISVPDTIEATDDPIPEAQANAEPEPEPEPEFEHSSNTQLVVVGGDSPLPQDGSQMAAVRYLQAGAEGPDLPIELAWVIPSEHSPGRWDFRIGIAGESLATGPKFAHGSIQDGPPPTGWRVVSPESAIVDGDGGQLEITALVKPITMESYLPGLADAGWDQLGDVQTMTEEDFLDAGVTNARHRRLLIKAKDEIVWPLPPDAEKDEGMLLKQQLQSLKLSELQSRAATAGVSASSIAEALDSTAQKPAMIALIVAQETLPRPTEPQMVSAPHSQMGEQSEPSTQPIKLNDTVTVVTNPNNSDFLSPGDKGTVVAVDDEDENDVWYTVQNASGETDEYAASDLVHAQAAGWQIQEQARPTLQLAHATGQYGILQSAWPSLTAECLSTALQLAHLDLGTPLALPNDAASRDRRGATKQAASRALDGLAACGVKSEVAQRAVLNETRALLKSLLRSERMVKAARRRKCGGRLGSKLDAKGFDKRFIATLEGIFDNGVLLVPLARETKAERQRSIQIGDVVLLVAEPSNLNFLAPGQQGTVVAVEDEDPDDLWYTVRDEEGETDEYSSKDLVLASSGLPETLDHGSSAKPTSRQASARANGLQETKSNFDVESSISSSDEDEVVATSERKQRFKAAPAKAARAAPVPVSAPAPVHNPRSIHFSAAMIDDEDEFDDDLFGGGASTEEEETAKPIDRPAPAPAPAPAPTPTPMSGKGNIAWKSAFDGGSEDDSEDDNIPEPAGQSKAAAARAKLAALMDSESEDGSLFD